MKKIAVIALVSAVSFPSIGATLEDEAKLGNSQAAYQLAEFYENNNDLKNALHWYKQAAKLSMQHQGSMLATKSHNQKQMNANDSQLIEKDPILIAEHVTTDNTRPIISDRVAMHQDYEVKNGAFKVLDSTFGLRPYHSNYILPVTYDSKAHNDGRKHVETAFQISFKKDIFTNTFGFDETIGFAYSQRNWWQITEDSSPFRETNYLPEVYVQIPFYNPDSSLKGTQFGFLHESNGQGNEAGRSRSWNRLYLEGYFQYKDAYIVPRAWYRIYENKNHDDNRDIQNYLGYGDLNIYIPYDEHLVKVLIRNNLNLKHNHGAFQIDWTYPLGDTGLFGYIQYFNGYGESLIDYNKKTNRIGFGVALSR